MKKRNAQINKSKAEEINQLQTQRDKLVEGLKIAAAKFREYEQMHLRKVSIEGAEKAARNVVMAKKLEAILAEVEGGK